VNWIHLAHEYGALFPGSCERGIEPSGSIKGGEFVDQLRDC
jgi:hypothetical protein